MRIAVTGNPGVGKTTLVKRVIEAVPLRAGGMITEEIRKCGRRVGFLIRDLGTGQEGILAHLHSQGCPRFGRYRLNLKDLELVGAAAICRAIREADLVVVDEVGPMELQSEEFVSAVAQALAGAKNLLVTVHRASSHPLAYRVRHEADHYLRLTKQNRDAQTQEVIQLFIHGQKLVEGTQHQVQC